jgi:hypothetical protein
MATRAVMMLARLSSSYPYKTAYIIRLSELYDMIRLASSRTREPRRRTMSDQWSCILKACDVAVCLCTVLLTCPMELIHLLESHRGCDPCMGKAQRRHVPVLIEGFECFLRPRYSPSVSCSGRSNKTGNCLATPLLRKLTYSRNVQVLALSSNASLHAGMSESDLDVCTISVDDCYAC